MNQRAASCFSSSEDEKERETLFGTSNFSKKFTGIETRKIARYILKTSLER